MNDNTPKDRLIGAVLDGRFRLDRLLGAGGMGKVYAGQQLSVDRLVAVKVLREELSESESLGQRFFREAKVVASLRHSNIVGLVDFGRDAERGLLYIAMEYVDGVSLAHLLRRGRLEAGLAVSITRQICSALAEAHACGVIHRDLKPDNVMLVTTAEGRLVVKVLDFGIALPTGEEARLTNTGAVVGTPHYMAPEQAQDRPITNQSDLFSLGVLLYEMLAGRLPFVADTPMAVLLKVITLAPPPITEALAAADLPPASLIALMERLLAKEPSGRPADISAVAEALDDIARTEQLVAPPVSAIADLDAYVVERASDEFVFAATAASPVPTPSSVASLAPPISTTDASLIPGASAKIPPQRRGLTASEIVMIVIGVCLSCCCIGVCTNNDDGPVSTRAPHVQPLDAGSTAPDVAGPDVRFGAADAGSVVMPEVDASNTSTAPPTPVVPPRAPVVPGVGAPPKPGSEIGRSGSLGGSCQHGTCNYDDGPVACGGDAVCRARCASGDCSQTCLGRADCTLECAGGGCTQMASSGASTARLDCSGGGCQQRCLGGATCEFSCSGGGCLQDCRFGKCATKSCSGGGCTAN